MGLYSLVLMSAASSWEASAACRACHMPAAQMRARTSRVARSVEESALWLQSVGTSMLRRPVSLREPSMPPA